MPGVNDGMSASAGMIAQLRQSEGTANGGGYYNDPTHNCTRGAGILVHPGDCTAAELATPPDTQANEADLMARIHTAERQVRSQVQTRALTQEQFDALVSAAFNMGGAGASPVLGAANRRDDRGVVGALRARVNARDRQTGRMVRLPGLVTRREQEARPFPCAGRAIMFRQAVTAGLLFAALADSAIAAENQPPAGILGKWRIGQWVGESQGGFSGPDPNSLLGKTVDITMTAVHAPGRTCRLEDVAGKVLPNSEIESSIWGGQRIDQLRLPKSAIAGAFGAERTRVIQDKGLCISAIMIGHDHMIDAFGSGVIYRLDRVK